MPKPATLTVIAALLTAAVVAGAIVITYCQFTKYAAACREGTPEMQNLQQKRVLEERLKEEKTQKLKEAGALVELKLFKDESGQVVIQAGERTFGIVTNEQGEKQPDYRALCDYIFRSMIELQEKPNPPALKVVINRAEDVEMKHVVLAMNECVRAGVKDVEFAAPSIQGLDD